MKKHRFLFFILFCLVVGAGVWWFYHKKAVAPAPATSDVPYHTSEGFNKNAHSLTDPNSIWVVVNKQRPLDPKNYAPDDLVVPNVTLRSNITGDEKLLRAEAARALEALVAAGTQEGLNFTMLSGYRSYNFQVALYNRYVREQSQKVADTQSARPGYSEHQTGLAVDLGSKSNPRCDIAACFGQTPEGQWLAAHASDYGFIVRYTTGDEGITGYIAEPWHIRYVGNALAQELKQHHVATLEQFFGLGAAPGYQ